jgi:hypothetical protein
MFATPREVALAKAHLFLDVPTSDQLLVGGVPDI